MYKASLCCALAVLAALPAVAEQTVIPEAVMKTLQTAYNTGDNFIIGATVKQAQTEYPQWADGIESYMNTLVMAGTTTGDIAKIEMEPAAGAVNTEEKSLWGWNGRVEAGANIQNGNTQSQALNAGITLNKEVQDWRYKVGATADSKVENNTRTEEAYNVNGRADYKIDERLFVFGETEFDKDLFSGYNYRITEALGVGYTVIKRDNLTVNTMLSAGGRHSENAVTEDMENEGIIKPAADLSWTIRDGLVFTQALASTIGEDRTITEANSALTTKLIGDWHMKLAYDIEHTSDVPRGTKETDTKTTLNLVYEF